MIRTLKRHWMHFWFEPTSPTNLSLCRLFVCGGLLLRYLIVPAHVRIYPEQFAGLWQAHPLLGILQLPVLGPSWLGLFEGLWLLALACSCLGLLTRLSTFLSFWLALYLLWIPHNYGKLHHTDMITVLVLAVFMLSRCGDTWSLDRVLKRKFRGQEARVTADVPPSGEYTWPIRIAWVIIVSIFFAAGITKLRNSGLDWVFSDNFSVMLIKVNYLAYIGYPPLLDWGLYVAPHVLLCQLLAGSTLLLELLSPLALFSRIARRIIAPALALFVLSILLFFMPGFVELFVCQLFWVPWDRFFGSDTSHATILPEIR